MAATGAGGVAGCLGRTGGDEPDAEEPLTVTVVNRLEREFTVEIGVLEQGQSFEEGIGWRISFGRGDDSIEVVEDDVTASEYRVILRADGFSDYEYDWDRAECVELRLKVEVREDGFRETARGCRRPQ